MLTLPAIMSIFQRITGALPAIGLKAGDHHLLESVGFINQPVPLSLDTDGNLTYNREIYRVKGSLKL